jgi:hypothetical protein
MSKDKVVTLLERFAPVVVWVMSTLAGVVLAWNDIKMDVRALQTRMNYNELQIVELKRSNDALILEMRSGFDKTQASIEKLYSCILDKHK